MEPAIKKGRPFENPAPATPFIAIVKLMSCKVKCNELVSHILIDAVLDPGHPTHKSAYQTGRLNSLLYSSVQVTDPKTLAASAGEAIGDFGFRWHFFGKDIQR
jgi:hypothetical protein